MSADIRMAIMHIMHNAAAPLNPVLEIYPALRTKGFTQKASQDALWQLLKGNVLKMDETFSVSLVNPPVKKDEPDDVGSIVRDLGAILERTKKLPTTKASGDVDPVGWASIKIQEALLWLQSLES